MNKSFNSILVMIVLTSLSVAACAMNIKEEVIVGDFSLTVTVDKTRAKVGDTITATVVFKNLSGRDIEAEIPSMIADLGGQNKEDILVLDFDRVSLAAVLWLYPDELGKQRPKILIESGAVIERKFKHTIKGSYNLEACAAARSVDIDVLDTVFTAESLDAGISENEQEFFRNQSRSFSIMDEAMRLFIMEPDRISEGRNLYNDSFAGRFIDDSGNLTICYVQNTITREVEDSINSLRGQVNYRQDAFSYNFLAQMLEVVTEVMEDFGIYAAEIDEYENRLFICLSDIYRVGK